MTRMRVKVEGYVQGDATLWAYSLVKGGRDEAWSTSSGYASESAARDAGRAKLAELEAAKLRGVGR